MASKKKLAPFLVLTGVTGAAAAFLKKRGAKAGDVAQQAADKAPDQVKQAAAKAAEVASDAVERAREQAEPLKQAADKAVGGDGAPDGADRGERRYAAPAEAGSQPPQPDSGDTPSSGSPVVDAPASESPELATPDRPHGDAVMPDTSNDDPLVREAEAAAAADAGSIGGNAAQMAQDDPAFPGDPERRPVIEGSGDPDEQTLEEHDRELGGNRETQP
jgi:hypothetical protein